MPPSDQLPAGPRPTADDRDWPAQAADTIVDVVGTARQKTTGPAIKVTRGVVFGLLIAVVALMALVLLVIALVRLAHNWVDVWLAYVIVGALFSLVGLLMWRQRTASGIDDGTESPVGA